MTPTPSAVSRRTTSNSVSISPSSRIADGSSMISRRTSRGGARGGGTARRAGGGRAGGAAPRVQAPLPRRRPQLADLLARADPLVAEPSQQRRRVAAHALEVEQRAAARLVRAGNALCG